MRVLVALALLFTVTPGLTEVVESFAHAVVHRDLPHHDEGGDPAQSDEHACTTLFHACGCHAPMSAQASLATVASHPDRDASMARVVTASSDLGRGSEPPPLPPPIG